MKKKLKELIAYIKPYKARLFQAAVSMMFLAALKGAIVYILKPTIDKVLIEKNTEVLKLLLIVLPAIFILKSVVQYINGYLMSWIGQKAVQKIRSDLFAHIHALSAEFYWRRRSSDVMARVINDLNNVQSVIQFAPLYLCRDILTVITLLSVLFYINWRFALISMAIIPPAVYILKILSKKMRKAGKESQVLISEISHKFQESLQGILVVKAFNYEKTAIEKFEKTNDAYLNKIMRYLRATVLSGPLMELLGSLMLVIMIYLGSREIFSGRMTTGAFFAFVGSFFTAYIPLKNIANLNAKLQLGLASWERISQILNEKPAVFNIKNTEAIDKVQGLIEFGDVSYKYPTRANYAIKNFSFKIAPGKAIAFVGPSGSGKTTIIHLLLRFFDPVAGNIFLDGRDIKNLNVSDYRKNIGIVTQDTVLFDDSVANNIALSKPGASKNEIIEAAKSADAHFFIKALPQGYDTVLGERGIKLSGGQKQRLAIARAILRKPKILILDEATSNLDTESEKLVQKAIEKTLKGRTVAMVAHRLSTVRNVDKIVVLKNSLIAETGSHGELMALDGVYKKLYEAQN